MSVSQSFEIVIDPQLVSRERLEMLMEKLADFQPVLQEIGTILEGQLAENFDTRGYGSWAPLSAFTLKDKQRKGYGGQSDLVRTGELRAALTERDAPGHKFLVSGSEVIVGVYGAVIPYASLLANGTARMPARILAQLLPGTQQQIIEIITEWLGGGEGIRVIAGAPVG